MSRRGLLSVGSRVQLDAGDIAQRRGVVAGHATVTEGNPARTRTLYVVEMEDGAYLEGRASYVRLTLWAPDGVSEVRS